MSAQNTSATNMTADKGKGKSVAEPQDVTMGEGGEDSSSDDVSYSREFFKLYFVLMALFQDAAPPGNDS